MGRVVKVRQVCELRVSYRSLSHLYFMKFLRSCLRTLVQDVQRTLVGGVGLRQPTTLTIDDELLGKAVALALALALAESGIERTELLRECIKAFSSGKLPVVWRRWAGSCCSSPATAARR